VFERYDEPARRSLFFARFAASQRGSVRIETEDLLLGLMRQESPAVLAMLSGVPLLALREELETGEPRAPISTHVEIPFSPAAKRVLHAAADEADGLRHTTIRCEHLLLGVLRESESVAAAALARHGVRLEGARERIASLPAAPPLLDVGDHTKALVLQLLDLTNRLAASVRHDNELQLAVMLIQLDVERLKARLDAANES
jgi:ATP-dependent Clp protease ATP-binding subunit ClpC